MNGFMDRSSADKTIVFTLTLKHIKSNKTRQIELTEARSQNLVELNYKLNNSQLCKISDLFSTM